MSKPLELKRLRSTARYRAAACIVALLALPGCLGAEAGGEVVGEDNLGITREELEYRFETEGDTPELIALARRFNEREALRNGMFYKLSLGADHELLMFESGSAFATLERIGRDVPDTLAPANENATPSQVFAHYRPGVTIPAVIVEAEARMSLAAQAAQGAVATPALIAEDQGVPAGDGLIDKHAGDALHFRDATHTSGGLTTKGCEDSTPETKQRLCWLDRTSGGFTEYKSTHARYHLGLKSGSSTTYSLTVDGSLKISDTILNGELVRLTAGTTWWCPGFGCSYYGYKAHNRRFSWNGSSRTWHMGAHYQDILRRD